MADGTEEPVESLADSYFRRSQMSTRQAVGSIASDPDQAARAMQLEQATGVPAPVINADVDQFEGNYRQSLTAHIVANNPHLTGYIAAHPMAAKVSNDDWGNLDEASQAQNRLSQEGALGKIFKAMKEGYGEDPTMLHTSDFNMPVVKKLVDAVWGQVMMPDTALRIMNAGLYGAATGLGEGYKALGGNEAEGARLTRDLIAMPQVAFPELMGPHVPPEFNALAKQAQKVISAAHPYLEAGIEPPVGVHPEIDKLKIEQSKAELKTLDEAFTAATKTNTRERSPELYKVFAQQHPDMQIGISAEAIRRLYGDEIPSAEDGKLGWVPDLEAQMRASEQIGGDVEVPLADWLAHADPEIAKELHDDIRIHRGGLTTNEIEGLKEHQAIRAEDEVQAAEQRQELPGVSFGKDTLAAEEMEAANDANAFQKETAPTYKAAVASQVIKREGQDAIIGDHAYWRNIAKAEAPAHDALGKPNSVRAARNYSLKGRPTIIVKFDGRRELFINGERIAWDPYIKPLRDAYSLEPKFDRGMESKLTLERDVSEEGYHRFKLNDETGRQVGAAEFTEENGGKNLYLNFIGGADAKGFPQDTPNAFGPRTMRDLLAQVQKEFPNAETISGERVSGARAAAGKEGKVVISLRSANDVDLQALADALSGGQWQKIGRETEGYDKPRELYTQNERKILDAVNEVLGRIAPSAEPYDVHALRSEGAPMGINAVFIEYRHRRPVIAWSLAGPDAVGTARHEAIHALYRGGFFTDDEWGILTRAAREGNWIRKHQIDVRYADMDHGVQLEEAIAEEFGKVWSKDPANTSAAAARIFEKLHMALVRLKEALQKALGRPDLTADDLFLKAESGEIGARKGAVPRHPAAFREAQQRGTKEPELPGTRRVEDTEAFAPAPVGMTVDQYRRYRKLIDQRDAEDADRQLKQSAEAEVKRQTAEWKENYAKTKGEVTNDVMARPDVGVDTLLRTGVLYGDKLSSRPKLASGELTEEQKAGLPPEYHAPGGVNPDDLAGLFGYQTGEHMVQALTDLISARGAMQPKEFLDASIRLETERRMKETHGDLRENILREAKEHVLSQTQFDLLHEDYLRLATKAGVELPLKQADMKSAALAEMNGLPMRTVSSDAYLAAAGRAGRAMEVANTKLDWREGLKQSERQNLAAWQAKEALKIEAAREKFDASAKRLGVRSIKTIEQEYTNFIHDILMRVGKPVRRSVQDLITEIEKGAHKDLASFVQSKINDGRVMPVAEWIQNSSWRKDLDELSVEEFKDVKNAVDTLAKQGRDESRLYREGAEADKAVIVGEMQEKLREFPLKVAQGEYSLKPTVGKKVRSAFRTLGIGMVNVETWLNRWDRDNPRGPFNQWITRQFSEAANSKNTIDREYAVHYQGLGEIVDQDKLVSAPLIDPLSKPTADAAGSPVHGFTRKNIAAMISNAGNEYNWNVLAKGWGADPAALHNWLVANSTKADWIRAQKMGSIFDKLYTMAERIYRHISGIAPERIELKPFTVKFADGTEFVSEGWYHPIIADANRADFIRKRDGDQPLGKESGFFDSIANGYTKKRTGKIYPLSLDYDQIPLKMNQMIHDIAFRRQFVEIQKLIKDKGLRADITKHYHRDYVDMLDDFLKDIAGGANYDSHVWGKFAQASEFTRQNVVGTVIDFNPYTVMKHGPTAWVNSMYEAGAGAFVKTFSEVSRDAFRQATMSIFGKGDEVGEVQWQFIKKNSEEIQRRSRHWSETIVGQHKDIYGKPTLRETIMELGTKPVAFSDMISAVPTWGAVYNKEIAGGADSGMATFLADRAVRRAHGSTAITNQPGFVRGGGPFHSWLTTLYGFFGTQMQRRAEIAFLINDTYKLGREGEIRAAIGNVPQLSALMFSAIIWPTLIEELVTGIGTEDHRTGLERLLHATLTGVSASILYARDIAYGIATDREPSVGLASTPLHDFKNLVHDLKQGKKMMDREHAGKTVEHFITMFGDVTGMGPKIVGHATRFGIDTLSGAQRPRTPADIFIGTTKGTMKRRIER